MIKKAILVLAVLLVLVITAGLALACSNNSTPATNTTTTTTKTTTTTATTTVAKAAPKLPANHAGRTSCLMCHVAGNSFGAPVPLASIHASFTDANNAATCLGCHK